MSNGNRLSPRVALLVSESDDESLRAFSESLAAIGVELHRLGDVYHAVANLAAAENISYVFLDVRTLDERELTFPRVVSRYFSTVEVIIPVLPGTEQRLTGVGGGLRALDVSSIIDTLRGNEPSSGLASAPVLVAQAVEDSRGGIPDSGEADSIPVPSASAQQPLNRLSTDGGPEAVAPGLALHDAVRLRMQGGEPRNTTRRMPPRATEQNPGELPKGEASASLSGLPPEQKTSTPERLSAEEMDALLAAEQYGEDATGEATDPTLEEHDGEGTP